MISREEHFKLYDLIEKLVEVNVQRERVSEQNSKVEDAENDLAEYMEYLTDSTVGRDTCYDNGQSCNWANDGFGGETCTYCSNSRELREDD